MEKHLLKVPTNTVGRDFTVGDIHGCYYLLDKALREVHFNKDVDRLFCLGDLVDRGPYSEAVASLLTEPWFYSVLGNHEQYCIEAHSPLIDEETKKDIRNSHTSYGGDWFYFLSDTRQKELAAMFDELPVLIELEVNGKRIGLAHGNINDWDTTSHLVVTAPDAIESNAINGVIWGRTRIRQRNGMVAKGIDHIFLGHTPVNNVTTLGNVHYIDTGAVFGGKLSLINIKEYLERV